MAQRLALIIGNSVYLDGTLSRLLTPDADVGALGELLLDPERGRFDDVKVLVNMSSHIIRRSIASFFSRRTRDDLLMLYFSGHGVLDDQGQLYLAVRDTDSRLLSGTAIPASYITSEMNNSRSQRQLIVLDCCHSGAFARGAKGQIGSSVGTAVAFEGTGYGRMVLTASDATQFAWEGDRVIGQAENSLFTHYLVEGIQSGKADLDRDGRITVDELYDYVYEQVIRQTPNQTPGKWSYKEQGEIVVATVPSSPTAGSVLSNLPEMEQNQEQRLEQLYNEGLSAFWLEEWDEAVHCFEALVEVHRDYLDAANKLELSRRNQRLRALYNQALTAETAGEWPRVIAYLEELALLEPAYKDVTLRLEQAQKAQMLANLYQEARQLSSAGKWQAVINIFSRIVDLQPEYPDSDGLLSAARKKVVELERLQTLDSLYGRALRKMDNSQWEEARQLLMELVQIEAGFKGAERLLATAEANIAEQQAPSEREQADTKRPEVIIHVDPRKRRIPGAVLIFTIIAFAGIFALIYFVIYPSWKNQSSSTTPLPLFHITDTFEQPQYDGSYDPQIWDIYSSGLSFVISQSGGRMELSSYGDEQSSEIHMKDTYNLPIAEPYYLEARCAVDESAHAATLRIVFGLSSGNAECQVQAWSQDKICCWTDFDGIKHDLPCKEITPGSWHTIRIEQFSTDPMIFDFSIDGEPIGSIEPVMVDKADTISEVFFSLNSYTKRTNIGYIDEINFGALH